MISGHAQVALHGRLAWQSSYNDSGLVNKVMKVGYTPALAGSKGRSAAAVKPGAALALRARADGQATPIIWLILVCEMLCHAPAPP